MKKGGIVLVVVLVILFGIAFCIDFPGLKSGKKVREVDILLIIIDTLRKDHLGCYGYPRRTTPHIDKLSKSAINYTNCVSQSPWTLPSVASLLCSKYPSQIDLAVADGKVNQKHAFLSEILQKHNYITGAVMSNIFLNRVRQFDQGFDFFNSNKVVNQWDLSAPGVVEGGQNILTKMELEGDHPFFLLLHFFDPHFNYGKHERFDFSQELQYSGPLTPWVDIRKLRLKRNTLTKNDIRYILSLYDSEIAITDYYVGKFFETLIQKERFDQALVIVTSDHGEEFLERNWIGHTITLHTEVMEVPLVMRYPVWFTHESAMRSTKVALLDIFPTILDFLNIPLTHHIEGHSLLSSGFKPLYRDRTLMGESSRNVELRSISKNDYKLIYDLKLDILELYNHSVDPQEKNDLKLIRKRTYDQLKGELQSWIEQNKGNTDEILPLSLSEDERKKLEALGYF